MQIVYFDGFPGIYRLAQSSIQIIKSDVQREQHAIEAAAVVSGFIDKVNKSPPNINARIKNLR
jgi:hypothetical protein